MGAVIGTWHIPQAEGHTGFTQAQTGDNKDFKTMETTRIAFQLRYSQHRFLCKNLPRAREIPLLLPFLFCSLRFLIIFIPLHCVCFVSPYIFP